MKPTPIHSTGAISLPWPRPPQWVPDRSPCLHSLFCPRIAFLKQRSNCTEPLVIHCPWANSAYRTGLAFLAKLPATYISPHSSHLERTSLGNSDMLFPSFQYSVNVTTPKVFSSPRECEMSQSCNWVLHRLPPQPVTLSGLLPQRWAPR